jgi:hypothetical protein
MNEEKMYPSGSVVGGSVGEPSCREGTQMKTKRYIEPSKHVCVRPRTRSSGSEKEYKSAYNRIS